MVAWITRPGRRPYVVAVLADRARAEAYAAALPAVVREGASVYARPDLALPCLLLDDAAGFRFLSSSAAAAALGALGRAAPDEDGVYGVLYRLDGEFLPAVPGRDEMGRVPHWHLNADGLAAVARGGPSALWAGPPEAERPAPAA